MVICGLRSASQAASSSNPTLTACHINRHFKVSILQLACNGALVQTS